MDYDYHFFYGLEKKMVAKTFPDWKPEFVDKAYANWNRHFNRTANLFYQSQLEAHTELVEKMFCRQYNLTSMDSLEEYEYQNLWRSFSNEHGLTAHKSQWDDKIYLSDLYHGSVGYYSGADAADNFLERMTSKGLHPHDTIVEMLITRLWFNTEFNNSPEIAAELRSMPYEDYLKTHHWKRVRAAMLIAHRARCQSELCENGDSYWMGYEHILHVHHVTYKNRGNERFEDLRLVCKDCHKHYHDTKADIFPKWETGVYNLMMFQYPKDEEYHD